MELVGRSSSGATLSRMSPESSGIVDPREGLVREYQRAVEELRRDLGEPQTLRDKWRFWRARRRLWREKVGPTSSKRSLVASLPPALPLVPGTFMYVPVASPASRAHAPSRLGPLLFQNLGAQIDTVFAHVDTR